MRKLGAIHRPTPAKRLTAGTALLHAAAPPASVDYTSDLPFDGSAMLGNDALGDCVEAAFLQLVRARWRRIAGEDLHPTTDQAIALYTAWSGYDPADPATDQGTDVLTALQLWGDSGIALKPTLLDIGPWFGADVSDPAQIKAAVAFGTGALFTLNLFTGDNDADSWDVPAADAASIGQHEVVCLGYDGGGPTIVTWDFIMPTTWPALLARLLAVSVPLSRLCMDTDGLSATGLRWAAVQRTLEQSLA